MAKKRIAVLRGGPSNEYDISLKTGAMVLKNISEDMYDVEDIFISRDGTWHRGGIPMTPARALAHSDVVFNALHGNYGEDGKVQHILEVLNIPHTGSKSFSSVLSMNKKLSKEIFKKEGMKTPLYEIVTPSQLEPSHMIKLFRTFALPFIVKPVSSGSSVGVTLVKNFTSFEPALREAFLYSDSVMIEEYIAGREATVGVIEGFRGQELYTLPVAEIASDVMVPSNFSDVEKKQLEDIARNVHKAFGLEHYSRTDFIVSPRRGIFVREVTTLPSLTEQSFIPKALHVVGSSVLDFVHHILGLALEDK